MWARLEVIEKAYGYTGRYLVRIAIFLRHFRIGKQYGYPTCCVAQFSLDIARRKPPALRRGAIQRPGKEQYIPCGYHKGGPFWKAFSAQPNVQLQLFEETLREAYDRKRRERKLTRRYSGRGFGRPYRRGG